MNSCIFSFEKAWQMFRTAGDLLGIIPSVCWQDLHRFVQRPKTDSKSVPTETHQSLSVFKLLFIKNKTFSDVTVAKMINTAEQRGAPTSTDSSAGSTLRARSKSTRTFRSSFIRQRKSAYLNEKNEQERQSSSFQNQELRLQHQNKEQFSKLNRYPMSLVLTLAHKEAH
jgi:hypothetical protein